MTQTPVYKHAIVRNVADSFDSCIKPNDESIIDIELAGVQHNAYRRILQELGLELLTLAADERHPDCCFVEDTAIVAGDRAVILHMGASSRVGEEAEVRKIIARYKKVRDLKSPATMDGGDVMAVGKKLFVGLSQRTTPEAASRLEELMAPEGYEVIAVPLKGILHLKSACSYLGDGCVLVSRGYFDDNIFSAYKQIIVHPDEAYSANCLAVNGTIVVSKGFPHTRSKIESAGFETIELDMSEFRKGGGSLTCLSILF
jgi:dimethylargininase